MTKKSTTALAAVPRGGLGGSGPGHVLRRHGADRESVRLPVITDDLAPAWEPVLGLPPGGREECRKGPRPCVYIHCDHHLWFVRADERHGGGDFRRDAIEPTPESCERDVSERPPDADPVFLTINGVKMKIEPRRSAKSIAKAFGRTPQRINQIVRGALEKLRADPDASPVLRQILLEMLSR